MTREGSKFNGKCFYSMETYSPITRKFEVYTATGWFELGFRILKFRLFHLFKYGRFVD